MMMIMRNRKPAGKIAKWVIVVMAAMMAARLLIFVLAAAGLISWGGSAGLTWMWMIPVAVIVMMALMFFLGPRMMHGQRGQGPEESALEILARRFARGELTKDQYEEMEKTLREHGSSSSRGRG